MSREEFSAWYQQNLTTFTRYSDQLSALIRNLLTTEGITYLSVNTRVKTLGSAIEKINRKEYTNPQDQMLDIIAVRVITYLESDMELVSKVISDNFEIIPEHSSDKSFDLGVDRIGYRSTHFVCRNHSMRLDLPEYRAFSDIKFELQVRTVLQHAWAEIEHSRRYKPSGVLPKEEARLFNLLSANLELLDKQFSDLAKRIDKYGEQSLEKTMKGDFSDEVNSISVKEYLNHIKSKYNIRIQVISSNLWKQTIEELISYGIEDIKQLNKLFSEEFIEALKRTYTEGVAKFESPNELGVLRGAMMFFDIDKYFSEAHNDHWNGFNVSLLELLNKKYSYEEIADISRRFNMVIPDRKT